MTFQTNFPLYPTKLPYLTISARGMSNSSSDIPNDGYDFGPDTMLGATSKDQYGPPYTQTMGLQEAWNYALANPINYTVTQTSSLQYYVPEIHFVGGVYDIYTPITINPPVYTYNGQNYTIGNIIMKGQGSMNPFLINHVTSDYMVTVVPDNVKFTNIEIDNLLLQSASGITGYGYFNFDFSSKNTNTNPFQSINLDVNAFTSHPPLNVNSAMFIALWNYEEWNNVSSTSPGSVFTTNNSFSAQSCIFNGNQIYAQNMISILGSSIGVYGTNQYGLIFPSGYNFNTPIAKVIIDSSFVVFPFNIGINVGSFEITKSTLATVTGTSYLLQGISGTTPTIEKLLIKHNSTYEYFNGLSLPAISTGITINEFDIDSVVGNTSNNFPYNFTANGTTAGTVTGHYATYSTYYKKVILSFSGYENDTTTNQTISYPLPFSTSAVISANNTGLTISTTTSGITITAPNSTTTYSGIVIIEGA